MRRLLPQPADEELPAVYDDLLLVGPVGRRCGISLGMVGSIDGAAAVAGRTAALGGEADHAAFVALRAAADAILVGAGTVRAEDYGPAAGSERRRGRRQAKGLAPAPRLAIVTNRLDLDPEARVFGDPAHPPLLVTTAAAAAARPDVAERGEVLIVGEERVDLPAATRRLAERGLGRVLCEGGPHLNAALFADGLIDEVYLTVAPTLVGGPATRIVAPPGPDQQHEPVQVRLLEAREHEGELLLRYRRQAPTPADGL